MNYPVKRKLQEAYYRGDKTIEVDGIVVEMVGDWTTLERGDVYVAGRNRGPFLLTVDHVQEVLEGSEGQQWVGCVYPVENEYPYDLGECFKVIIS